MGRTSCLLEWCLVWLSFGELLDATESLPLALLGVPAWDIRYFLLPPCPIAFA